MNIRIAIIILFLFLSIKSFSQNEYHFVRKYGLASPYQDLGLNLIKNIDNTYFALGLKCTICIGYPNDRKYLLYKFDGEGNIINQSVLYDTASHTFISTAFFEQGGKLKLCGTEQWNINNSTFSQGKVITFDLNLNLLSLNIVGDTSGLINNAYYFYPINTNETIYCGIYNDIGINLRTVLAKFDTSNTINWLNYYTDFYSGEYIGNYFEKILTDTDSNYIAIGNFRKGLGFSETEYAKSWLKKFDSNGNEIWDKKIIDSSYANCGLSANDGKVIIGGIKNIGYDTAPQEVNVGPLGNAPYVAKFNPTTNTVEWLYKFTFGFVTGSYGGNKTVEVVSANGNGYVSLVNVQDTPVVFVNRPMSVLIKLDENGNELWRKRFAAPNDSTIYNDTLVVWEMPLILNALTTTPDGGYLMVGRYQTFENYNDVILIKTNCNGDTASPKAAMNVIVDAATPNLMQVYNLSQYYDTCTFVFSDNSPNINLTMYDTVQTFTHAFAPGTTVTCIAKACNQEWDTVVTAQIITDNYNIKTNQGYLQNPIPNPTNGNTTINYYLPPNTKQASVTITNQFGQIVQNQNIANSNNGKLVLQTENLSNSIYMINLVTENGMIGNRKLVVNH